MVITANANKELDIPSVLQILLARYMQGDWGNLCESDKQLNDSALKYGDRIFASYTDANDRKFWIITEADRVLLLFYCRRTIDMITLDIKEFRDNIKSLEECPSENIQVEYSISMILSILR